MLGQPASWHTVCRPSLFTKLVRAVYSGPIRAVVLIHGGLRSIGVSALRASTRSNRRPSGASVTCTPSVSRTVDPAQTCRGGARRRRAIADVHCKRRACLVPSRSRCDLPASESTGRKWHMGQAEGMELRIMTEPQAGARYDDLLAVARQAEATGFGAFFRSDHYLSIDPARDGRPGSTDAWTSLAGLARETSRIRLGTLVSSATFRWP